MTAPAAGRTRRTLSRTVPLAAAALLLAVVAVPALSQSSLAVEGRVVDASERHAVPFAGVELEGHGTTLTDADGAFRFAGVRPGGYVLRVLAFGYVPVGLDLLVERDTAVSVALEPAPVPLDPLVVRPRDVDLEGRVRDPANDIVVVGADVLTNLGRAVRTNAHGRFRMRDILEGVPIRVGIRAFGYLPVDTVLLPRDEMHHFELTPDRVVEAMIDVQVRRLEERAAPRFGPMFRNMNRDELLRYAGSHSLRSILEFRHWAHLERVRAVVVDGRRYNFTDDPVSELGHLLPEELQRVEFIYAGRRSVVVVVYTRDYMRALIARSFR